MSTCEGFKFSICRSMQTVQCLTQSGGASNHFMKWIGKIDEDNYAIVFVDNTQGRTLTTKATFLHNTKLASAKINEEK